MHRRNLPSSLLVAALSVLPIVALVAAPAAGAPRGASGVARVGTAPAAIVFVRGQGHPYNGEIWTMGLHGGNQVRLTNNDVQDYDPEWSPDGTRIAWTRYEIADGYGPSDVWIMNPDGSDPHNVTADGDDISGPSWSPDGTQIAFTRDYHIWIVNADGSGEHDISPAGAFEYDPAWSPDGSRIAFAASVGASSEIFVMNVDGSDRHQLSHTVGVDENAPAWSPDGSRIAYSGYHRTTFWHVDMMRSDGAGHHIVIEAYSLDPAWSPDGSKLAFYACGDDGCRLYRSSPSGRHMRPLGPNRDLSDESPDYREVVPVS